MKIRSKSVNKVGGIETELLVVGVSSADLKNPAKSVSSALNFASIDSFCNGAISDTLRRSKFKGGAKDSQIFLPLKGSPFKAIFCVGLGDKTSSNRFDELARFRRIASLAARQAKSLDLKKIGLFIPALSLGNEEVQAIFEGAALGSYSFDFYKSEKNTFAGIQEIVIYNGPKISEDSIRVIEALCEGTRRARDLMNLSALDLTPKVLVEKSKSLSKELKLSIEVFDKTKLKKIGAGGILGVGQGSDRPPYLIKLKYKPRSKASKHIILIGKGITFDSGGLSIKPADGMEEMKHDMGGAAAVFGAMYAIGRVKPDCAVTAYIPAAENMTGGNAIHPGDVLKIVNGKTVEVLNTDAEGRLILADALSLAMREKPDYVIDLATLTGAAVVALGSHYAPIFSSSDELSNALISCGDLSGEHIWRLPLVEEYREYMKSSLADLRNTSTKREAGAITAALFLQEFVKADIPWAHIDIAGPAIFGSNIEHIPSGGTGFGARTIARFVFSVAKKVNKRK